MVIEAVRCACAGPFCFVWKKRVRQSAHESKELRALGLSLRRQMREGRKSAGSLRVHGDPGGGRSEQIANHAGIAGTQPLQPAQCFLRRAVRRRMVKEAVERFGQDKTCIVPLAAEQAFGQALASEFAGAQTDENSDLTIVATGYMLVKALEAAEKLAAKGIQARVVNIHTIKPIDAELTPRSRPMAGAAVDTMVPSSSSMK